MTTGKRAREFNALFHGARLDKAMGEKLRVEVEKLVKKYGNASRTAKALGVGINAVLDMMRGKGNGSLGLAILVSEKSGVPLKDIVGETLAKTGTSKLARIREDSARQPPAAPPPPPPVRTVPVPPVLNGVLSAGARQAELVRKVRDGLYTEVDIDNFIAEYERVRRENQRLKDLVFTFILPE